MATYRLGNQPQEYELKEDFLGWVPKGEKDWQLVYAQDIRRTELTIVNPNGGGEKILFLHHFIIRDAFPLSFFGEERARNWWSFAIVSENEVSEKFIIPLH
ncbi:MAG: hypothetical protein ACD_81C00098G0003 [uncultured bacterium]|uniref:Uncharacterized protein n=1 Tax=Candidatus Wolfebacteria bacterium GW2011_GWE2_44_13 TaxID=1619017 RepID=A0A0G1HAY6_9BACT|nr:MAG: hypothetical protein ACD_81C00098G0003 [uncultured bacterium]KKT43950.1 MAG: hypothetical protein UW32_C0001G0542 [Candidatus Wolfebacteria bacterium GW2011_GWE2_44_13]